MTEELRIKLDNESLTTLLRSNLSCFMGKCITQELLNEITVQIIESIDFFINKEDENF
jgi:hypothetical protein